MSYYWRIIKIICLKNIITSNFFKVICICFLFLSFSAYSLKAEILNKLEISGNERISDETVIVYGEIQRNKNYTQDDIDGIIKKLYETKFFTEISNRDFPNISVFF